MKYVKTFENYNNLNENINDRECKDGWVLRVYNEEDEIVSTDVIDQEYEMKALSIAEKRMDNHQEYDDGWDWSLEPNEGETKK